MAIQSGEMCVNRFCGQMETTAGLYLKKKSWVKTRDRVKTLVIRLLGGSKEPLL